MGLGFDRYEDPIERDRRVEKSVGHEMPDERIERRLVSRDTIRPGIGAEDAFDSAPDSAGAEDPIDSAADTACP